MRPVRVGMLGSGFIGEFHALGLRYVPDTRVVANYGAGRERREAFAARFGSRPHATIEEVCADPGVDLVVVSLPNQLHVEAVEAAARHGKAVACTKPLGRNADEAAAMLRTVTAAAVFHAYLENVDFNPDETFVDGYVVNAVIDAAYRSIASGRWEPVAGDAALAARGSGIPAGASA